MGITDDDLTLVRGMWSAEGIDGHALENWFDKNKWLFEEGKLSEDDMVRLAWALPFNHTIHLMKEWSWANRELMSWKADDVGGYIPKFMNHMKARHMDLVMYLRSFYGGGKSRMIRAVPFDHYRSAVMLLRLLRRLKVIDREQKNRAHDLITILHTRMT